MEVINFITQNWEYIAVIAAIVGIVAQLGKNGISKAISTAMLFAEKKANAALAAQGVVTGEQKKAFVVDYVYNKMPAALKPFITKEYVAKKVENIIIDLNDIKDDGTLNGTGTLEE